MGSDFACVYSGMTLLDHVALPNEMSNLRKCHMRLHAIPTKVYAKVSGNKVIDRSKHVTLILTTVHDIYQPPRFG